MVPRGDAGRALLGRRSTPTRSPTPTAPATSWPGTVPLRATPCRCLGFAGGFSLISISVTADLGTASVLTGTLGAREWGTGPSLLSLVRSQHPWIGAPEFGGAGLIPLRRPYPRFTAPGLALVGDAAGQMFPAHGSGIGIGLVAGAMLAEATAGLDDPGDRAALWGYQSAFQREHGGTLAAYDVIRRLSSRLGTPGVAEMFRSGLVGPDSTLAGLRQEWWSPAASELPRLAAGLAARPGLAARVLPALGRASTAHRVYAAYPDQPDEGGAATVVPARGFAARAGRDLIYSAT